MGKRAGTTADSNKLEGTIRQWFVPARKALVAIKSADDTTCQIFADLDQFCGNRAQRKKLQGLDDVGARDIVGKSVTVELGDGKDHGRGWAKHWWLA